MNLMMKLSVVLPLLLLLASCAEIKDTGRAIGHGSRDVAKKVGHTTRDVTKKIGHASRDAAKAVSKETKEVVEDLKGDDQEKSCRSNDAKTCKKIKSSTNTAVITGKSQMDLKIKQVLVCASVCTVAGTLLLSSAALKAEPQLSGNSSSPYCQDALLLAKSVFYSNTPKLYAVTSIPANVQSKFVLGASGPELPGRGALQHDPQLFTRADTLYWQQQAANAKRLVLTETAMGWQGERYALYQLPPDLSLSAFIAKDGNNIDKEWLLLPESWRPPLVFQHQQTGDFWFIDVGEPYQLMGSWQVYKPQPDGYQQSCSIEFTDDREKPHAPLPDPVQQLIVLLDQTLGYPEDEGTLQPTVRNRLMASHLWANAALRPWAISAKDSYNNKQQVDAGLLEWSLLNKKNLAVYQQIQSLLPLAQQALADYYQDSFDLEPKAAAELASWVLKIGYCVNFTFSGGGAYHSASAPDLNPWQTFNK